MGNVIEDEARRIIKSYHDDDQPSFENKEIELIRNITTALTAQESRRDRMQTQMNGLMNCLAKSQQEVESLRAQVSAQELVGYRKGIERAIYLAKSEAFERRTAYCVVDALESEKGKTPDRSS